MLLGGLWHGAGWTFLFWGFLHGAVLALCRLWRGLVGSPRGTRLGRLAGRALTFPFVLLCWVPFRAADWAAMQAYYGDLFVPAAGQPLHRAADEAWPVALALAVALLLPTLEQVMARIGPVLEPTASPLTGWRARLFLWAASTRWALLAGLAFAFAVSNAFSVTKFLYFDF